MDLSRLTAAQILAIRDPERLFTGDLAEAKKEYRGLSKSWHPDLNPGTDSAVMGHINMLYDLAVDRIKNNTWVFDGQITFTSTTGRQFTLRYLKRHEIELGEMYVGENVVGFALHRDNDDLYTNALQQIVNFKFADDKMKSEMSRGLPGLVSPKSYFETDERLVVVFAKSDGALLLRDVITHLGGKLDPKHVAWVISGMYNLACYLSYTQLAHCAINPDTVFINPADHTSCLLGGWWYSVKRAAQLSALPGGTVNQLPDDLLTKQVGDPRIDLTLVKALGRELLGDVNGSKLLMNKDIPQPLVTWLRSPAGSDAIAEYKAWIKVLEASFGPRRFVEMKLTAADIYK